MGSDHGEFWRRAVDGEPEAFGVPFERHAPVYNNLFRRTAEWFLRKTLPSVVFLEAGGDVVRCGSNAMPRCLEQSVESLSGDRPRRGAVYVLDVKMLGYLIMLVFLLSGCSKAPSVLTAGYDRIGGKSPSPNAEEAAAQAAMVARNWEDEIQSRARHVPEREFSTPLRDELTGDLRTLAQKNNFDLVSVRLLGPRQLAPKIVVRTMHYLDLAHAIPAILHRLNPRAGVPEDSQGWKYEGFYFEAQDEHCIPFLIVFNFERGPSAGGGQWARSEPLYPYAHG